MKARRRDVAGSTALDEQIPADQFSLRPSSNDGDEVVAVSKKVLHSKLHAKQAGYKCRNLWIFFLGGISGLLLSAFLANQRNLIDFGAFADISFEPLFDVLPATFIKEARELQKHEKETVNYDSFAVGLAARAQGLSAKHPVVMIPGVISTGLESWSTTESSRAYFRKRLWGSWSMMRALVLDKSGWKRHVVLDPDTGLDPPGIKLRAAQGFDATDFFITGYWIWNKILENLATIGYDPSNSFTAAYDWRLAYQNLEERDQYFTRLKMHIELTVRISGEKAVLLSHSMGSQVFYYFLQWVQADGHGNGGPAWVDSHVDSWINISGSMLGAVKGVSAVFSGEMKDTAQLNAFAVYGLEKFFSRQERAEIFRAMPGISSMLPMGGDVIWGNNTSAPDDKPGQQHSFGDLISFRQDHHNISLGYTNYSVNTALPFLLTQTEDWYRKMIGRSYSFGIAHTQAEIDANRYQLNKWINPLETSLPNAPNLNIYCFYGIGKATERAYIYRPHTDALSKLNFTIDTGYSSGGTHVDHGVRMGEGDGTVNLLSMGYMCAKGWKMKRYNPGGATVKIYEMPHEPDRFSARGGPNTADHVDILGRTSLNELILRIAGGKGHTIPETILSDILEYVEKIPIHDD